MEQILHYVWKHKLFQRELKTTEGVVIEILDVGQHNIDAGPDFFNAKVKVGDRVWVGNIEIHQSSDDWVRHGHDTDSTYNSVILHVVEKSTKNIYNEAKLRVPQCEIKYSQKIKENIDFLLFSDVSIPCCNYLEEIKSVYLKGWLDNLLLERLERKSNDIMRLLTFFRGSWADVFYVLLSRSMGFGLNSDSFERLAMSLPLNILLKQMDNPIQIEAMLLGQAGFLESCPVDEYVVKLKSEYAFLQTKYALTPLNPDIFRRMRTRPASSPFLRLAQLASLLQNIQGLCAKVIESRDIGQIRLLFQVNPSEYWQTHYSLGEESPRKSKYIGDTSLDIMIINAVIPLIFSYGKKVADEAYVDRALSFLESVKPESNSIVREFSNHGISASNAGITQALIQLKREYCEKKKCLYCRVGYKLLSLK